MRKTLRVNSIRLYYLDDQNRINGTRQEKYGIGENDVVEYNWSGNPRHMKNWAIKKLRVDKRRAYSFEVRTTKGRFLFNK